EQDREPGALQHGASAVAVRDVADLVGNDAGELVRGGGGIDQSLEHVDVSARQRDRVTLGPAHDHRIEWDWKPGRRLELVHELFECGAAGSLLRRISAFESGTGMAAVKGRPRLRVDCDAELALERVGD